MGITTSKNSKQKPPNSNVSDSTVPEDTKTGHNQDIVAEVKTEWSAENGTNDIAHQMQPGDSENENPDNQVTQCQYSNNIENEGSTSAMPFDTGANTGRDTKEHNETEKHVKSDNTMSSRPDALPLPTLNSDKHRNITHTRDNDSAMTKTCLSEGNSPLETDGTEHGTSQADDLDTPITSDQKTCDDCRYRQPKDNAEKQNIPERKNSTCDKSENGSVSEVTDQTDDESPMIDAKKGLQDRLAEMESENKQLQDRIASLTSEQESNRKIDLEFQQEIQSVQENINEKGQELNIRTVQFGKMKFPDMGNEEDSTQRVIYEMKIRQLNSEVEDLKMRLSRIISNRVTDNNPDVTDLSDQNRPTKLADRYSELYSNEWSDAFEVLEKNQLRRSERKIIQLLLEIVINVYANCKKIADDELKELTKMVFKFSGTKELTDEMKASLKHLKEKRKLNFQKALPALNKFSDAIAAKMIPSKPERCKIRNYISLVTELCWLMCIQDPPVYMETHFEEGKPFAKDIFFAFTATGAHNHYLVWPPLFLFEGGQLLRKGVAQAKSNKKKKPGYLQK